MVCIDLRNIPFARDRQDLRFAAIYRSLLARAITRSACRVARRVRGRVKAMRHSRKPRLSIARIDFPAAAPLRLDGRQVHVYGNLSVCRGKGAGRGHARERLEGGRVKEERLVYSRRAIGRPRDKREESRGS